MDHVRKLMGFLLAAAAVWLFYVLANQVSSESLAAIELGLLALALFVWLRYRALQGPSLRRLAALGMVAIAVGTVAFAARTDGRTTTRATSGSEGERLIAWQDFDRDRATALAGEGRVVFVDVTADWCFTCKVNENLVLETPEVAAAFARFGVVPMRADWTNRDDRISSFMAQYGRSSIPFYLIFRPGDEPYVFSELLTKDHLLTALEEIGGAPPANAGLGG